jgi:hypothetical protein
MQDSTVQNGEFKIGNPNFKQDLLLLHAEGEKPKSAIIDLAREKRMFLEH